MDIDLIHRKLDSLGRCIHRIELKRPATLDSLIDDVDLQDILSINLERAVQLCVDIGAHLLAELETPPPETMGEVFSSLAANSVIHSDLGETLRKAVGFRNLSVHAYDRVDWQRVFEIAHHRIDDFRQFAKCVCDWSENRG
jgi:uncharacterized protein YutE (UPF0331/DUF86 family)